MSQAEALARMAALLDVNGEDLVLDALAPVLAPAIVPEIAPLDINAQPLDANLTAIAALTTTSHGRGLLTSADAAASRTAIGAGTSSLGLGTSPSTQAFGDSAAGGAATDAAKTDHKHAFPALGTTPSTQAFADAAAGGSATTPSKNDHKHAMPTLGYGLSGNSAPAVGLTTASGLATAETTVSAATYADITGASVSLAAGTWLLFGTVNGRAANLAFLMNVAITDGANAVVRDGSQFVPASGTASVNALGNVNLQAIVSPGSTTTYKLRAARGLTTLTQTWVAVDGSGTNVTNNASTNTDKGTGIIAVRIA